MVKKSFYEIFSELNKIPRASHHEERVADYLCDFAKNYGLQYRRDKNNCVVIEKPATPGYENAESVVFINHMDMVCVAKDGYLRDGRPYNPLTDEIRTYIETDEEGVRWMKAEGTSLGADNGIGLSMALSVLSDDTIVHPALEVLTTTNEEDGMSGAEGLSEDFIRGRKVLNLDSEAYDEITVGAAGACLQVGKWHLRYAELPEGYVCQKIVMDGGLGGHSGVDINKGRCNCNHWLFGMIANDFVDDYGELHDVYVCHMQGGTANASIASCAEIIVAIPEEKTEWWKDYVKEFNNLLNEKFVSSDSSIKVRLEQCEGIGKYIIDGGRILRCLRCLPCGVIEMRKDMPDTVMTSNNIGKVWIENDVLAISCHTRSFDNMEQSIESDVIHDLMIREKADEVERLMDTSSWVEREDSPLIKLTCQTFKDVLGFEPKKVAMHFVLEAAYYVKKYPGIEIASIGPKIIEPHSPSERINLNSAENIWKVVVELLKNLKKNGGGSH